MCRARPRYGSARASRTRRMLRARSPAPSRGRPGTPRAATGAPTRSAGRYSVGRLLERGDREPVLGLRMESHPALAERRERGLLQLLHFAPPLHGNTRLDPRLAAVAERDGVPVRLSFLELIVFAKPLEDPRLGLLLGQPGQSPRLVVHPPVGTDHGQLREAVVAADLVILRIVAR